MMKSRLARGWPFIAAAFFFVTSCYNPYSESAIDDSTGGGDVGQSTAMVDDLFESGTAGDGSALFSFETNNTSYISDNGYTIWTLKASSQDPFVERTIVLNKFSGASAAGYGAVFCHHEKTTLSEEKMLVAMINTQQEYIVGEAVAGEFTEIVPWTQCAYLKKGYNQNNTMTIKLDSASRAFTLSLNDTVVTTFSAIESDYTLSGNNGYVAVISPWDVFPDTPVHVSYNE